MLNETFFGKFPTPCCHHISCFLKTRQSDILPSRHENPISLFLREHRFFAELRGQLQFFLLGKLTNLPLAFETVHCNTNQKNISFYFFTTFFMNQFGCCEDFFKVRDTSKKWPFSLVLKRHISFFIHKMTRQNVNLGTLFTCLFSWFVALGHKLPPTRLRASALF